jgi:carboxylesterase
MKEILSGGEPFFFPGGDTGCLLIHGFTGAPKEMRWMGDHLAEQGFTVFAPRLFGHATQPSDIIRARWHDWVASAEDGYRMLEKVCSRIFIMGLSMGGALTLILSARYPTSGIVVMSTPHTIPHRVARTLLPLIPILSKFWKYSAKGPSDYIDQEALAEHVSYDVNPVRSVIELDELLAEMRSGLSKINVPAQLIYSTGDQTVSTDHAHAIFDALATEQKDLLWVEKSGHIVTRDAERGVVFAAATDFVRRVIDQQ